MDSLKLIATTTAGLEAVVKRELRDLGYRNLKVERGRVSFPGEAKDIPRCNTWLRCAERILLEMGRLYTPSFNSFYEGIQELPFGEILPREASFPVIVQASRSQLKSLPSCQSVAKKAVVDSLSRKYKIHNFQEEGPLYKIIIYLEKDEALVTLDTTGDSLHKRGYRTRKVKTPLQETLAAGLIYLSYWQGERPLIDPFCGSGTIPIEAALIYQNRAPGLYRTFISNKWPFISPEWWREAKIEAQDTQKREPPPLILGSDINREAIQKAIFHSKEAQVSHLIKFSPKPFSQISLKEDYSALITNPPYGIGEGEREQVEDLYGCMGRTLKPLRSWSFYILTAHKGFEKLFSQKATRRRKLYNGGIECQFYQYHGPFKGENKHG